MGLIGEPGRDNNYISKAYVCVNKIYKLKSLQAQNVYMLFKHEQVSETSRQLIFIILLPSFGCKNFLWITKHTVHISDYYCTRYSF